MELLAYLTQTGVCLKKNLGGSKQVQMWVLNAGDSWGTRLKAAHLSGC